MLIKKDKNRRKIQLLTQVYNLAKVHGKVNTLIIQRKLKIGYGTAWRLIDALVLLDILDRKKEPCGCSYSIITNTPTKQKLNKKQEQLIKNNAEKLGAIYGPLYSLIHFNQINKRYEKAVMLAIRVYLNNFVVDTRETILNCIRFSKAHNLPPWVLPLLSS